MIGKSDYTFTPSAALSGFDPGKSDKLVATFSHENSSISEVTYGGVRMALALSSKKTNRLRTAIYYLDSPGKAGDLVVSFHGRGRPNGVGGSLLALSNTAAGAPAVTAEAETRSTRLTTPIENTFLVATHISNDHRKTAGDTAQSPLESLFSGPVGSAAGGSGYMRVASRSSVVPTFSTGSAEQVIAAAVFAPHH